MHRLSPFLNAGNINNSIQVSENMHCSMLKLNIVLRDFARELMCFLKTIDGTPPEPAKEDGFNCYVAVMMSCSVNGTILIVILGTSRKARHRWICSLQWPKNVLQTGSTFRPRIIHFRETYCRETHFLWCLSLMKFQNHFKNL